MDVYKPSFNIGMVGGQSSTFTWFLFNILLANAIIERMEQTMTVLWAEHFIYLN